LKNGFTWNGERAKFRAELASGDDFEILRFAQDDELKAVIANELSGR